MSDNTTDLPNYKELFGGPHEESNQFGRLTDFFPINGTNGEKLHLYQNNTSKTVTMVQFKSNKFEKREYDSRDGYVLAAAVSGKQGEFYYLLVEDGSLGSQPKKAYLYRAYT